MVSKRYLIYVVYCQSSIDALISAYFATCEGRIQDAIIRELGPLLKAKQTQLAVLSQDEADLLVEHRLLKPADMDSWVVFAIAEGVFGWLGLPVLVWQVIAKLSLMDEVLGLMALAVVCFLLTAITPWTASRYRSLGAAWFLAWLVLTLPVKFVGCTVGLLACVLLAMVGARL